MTLLQSARGLTSTTIHRRRLLSTHLALSNTALANAHTASDVALRNSSSRK
jgi:hypothetical protein